MKKTTILITCFLIMLLFLGGCKWDMHNLVRSSSSGDGEQLINARIVFTDGENIEGYIKNFGVEKDGIVYVGGSSLSYVYDKDGNITGAYNYQRVLYITVLPEKEAEE